MKASNPLLVIIVGPTGSGKSDLVAELAGAAGGAVISADSMQVYRYMDIGTAKPSPQERSALDYHLLDVADPDEEFSAAAFLPLARQVIEARRSDKLVYVVGGTGLYVKILLGGIIDGPGPDEGIRAKYRDIAAQRGREGLYRLLRERDPEAARRINAHDMVRTIRALEVLDLTGVSIVKKQQDHGFREKAYRYLKIGIKMDRDTLQERINRRVDAMMAAGLAEEVNGLLDRGYDAALKSMQSLGYRHMVHYLRHGWTREEAVSAMKRDTWQYAKRQMTWFKKDTEIQWHDIHHLEEIIHLIR
jgi:tRNA dimethylallyltransferase